MSLPPRGEGTGGRAITDTEAKKAFGRLDVLVNTGIYEFAPLEEVTAEHSLRSRLPKKIWATLLDLLPELTRLADIA